MSNYVPNSIEAYIVEAMTDEAIISQEDLVFQPIIAWKVDSYGGGNLLGDPVTVNEINGLPVIYFPKCKTWIHKDGLSGTGLDSLVPYLNYKR